MFEPGCVVIKRVNQITRPRVKASVRPHELATCPGWNSAFASRHLTSTPTALKRRTSSTAELSRTEATSRGNPRGTGRGKSSAVPPHWGDRQTGNRCRCYLRATLTLRVRAAAIIKGPPGSTPTVRLGFCRAATRQSASLPLFEPQNKNVFFFFKIPL